MCLQDAPARQLGLQKYDAFPLLWFLLHFILSSNVLTHPSHLKRSSCLAFVREVQTRDLDNAGSRYCLFIAAGWNCGSLWFWSRANFCLNSQQYELTFVQMRGGVRKKSASAGGTRGRFISYPTLWLGMLMDSPEVWQPSAGQRRN